MNWIEQVTILDLLVKGLIVGRVFLIHVTTNILTKKRRNEKNEDENGKNAAESNGTGPEGILSQEPGTRWNPGYGGSVHYRAVVMRSHEG